MSYFFKFSKKKMWPCERIARALPRALEGARASEGPCISFTENLPLCMHSPWIRRTDKEWFLTKVRCPRLSLRTLQVHHETREGKVDDCSCRDLITCSLANEFGQPKREGSSSHTDNDGCTSISFDFRTKFFIRPVSFLRFRLECG